MGEIDFFNPDLVFDPQMKKKMSIVDPIIENKISIFWPKKNQLFSEKKMKEKNRHFAPETNF